MQQLLEESILNYILAYYAASLLMSFYVNKRHGIEFKAEIGGRKFNRALTLFVCSPLILPFMTLIVYNDRRK